MQVNDHTTSEIKTFFNDSYSVSRYANGDRNSHAYT